MKKKKNFLSIAIGIIFCGYILFSGDTLEEITSGLDNVSEEVSSFKENVSEEISKDEELSENLEVFYIDVGQADAILLRKNEKNILIDAGNNEDGQMLVNYFKKLNISEFEYVFATHAHEDHIGGMDDVIKNFKVNNFYMPDVLTTTKTFVDVLDSLIDKNMKYEVPKIDNEIALDDLKIKILSIDDDEEDLNSTSIVLKVIYGNNSFLFTGDATNKVEESIITKDIKCDVLKVAHHGSSLSNSNEFLKKANPTYAIISVGKNNSYNHPHVEVLKRLENLNIKVYRTDELGTIVATSDGKEINITSDNQN